MTNQDHSATGSPPTTSPPHPQPITIENYNAFFGKPSAYDLYPAGVRIEHNLKEWLKWMTPAWFSMEVDYIKDPLLAEQERAFLQQKGIRERAYLQQLGINDRRALERAVGAFVAWQRGLTVEEVRVYRDENGKYGLETVGSDWATYSEKDMAHPWDDSYNYRSERTPFTQRITAPGYDSIAEIAREVAPRQNCPRELRYLVGIGGKVGVLSVRISSPKGWQANASDGVEVRELLPVGYDAVAEAPAPPIVATPRGFRGWNHLVFVRTGRKTWRGPADQYQVLDYPVDRSHVAVKICEAGSWQKLVRKLKAREPRVSDETLTQASVALSARRAD
jgi:hypothetical protein